MALPPASDTANASDALYMQVAAAAVDEKGARSKVFLQEDLMAMGNFGSAKELMPLIQYLVNHNLLRMFKISGKLGWSPRPRDAARQIQSLERDDKIVYEIIEEAHTGGIWSKQIKQKTNIAHQNVTRILARMEKANLIKGVKSVKAPVQRTYMLSHLIPSEDVTGNSFFDSGDLDEGFRDELMNLIIFWVRQNSWVEDRKSRKRGEAVTAITVHDDDDVVEIGGTSKKRKRAAVADIEDAGGRIKQKSRKFDPEMEFTQLIYRAGSHDYPTADDIHQFLTSSDAIKPTKAASLTVPEIQSCIDVLIWDDKLERVRNPDSIAWGYRTVRGISFRPPGDMFEEYEEHVGNGLTQSPCGRCPVLDLCHEGGPVNPTECVYFDQWLKA